MARIFFLSIILLIGSCVQAQVIPDERTTNWSLSGLSEAIPDYTIEINIKDLGAAGDGIQDDTEFLLEAINSLEGTAGKIFFPQGEYLFSSTIQLPDSCTLSGIDSTETHLIFDFEGEANHCFSINGSAQSDFIPIISGYTYESTSLTLENTNNIVPGNYLEMIQDNGIWDTNPISWANNCVGQILKVAEVNGNTITFEQPLRIEFQEELNPRLRVINPATHVSIENLKITRVDEPEEGSGNNFYFYLAKNCRIFNIESSYSFGSHIYFGASTNCEVRNSFIHDAFTFDGVGTRGYGVTLNHHTGECLIENNVFKKLRHAMMVKTGANGNVFGYNYSIEPYRSEDIHDYTGDISLHGHYAFSNLFEGNIVQNIIIDHYWGPSGPHNTFFRNRAELYGIMITYIGIPLITSSQNFVGNEITSTDFLYGNYDIHGENHFEYGNQTPDGIVPVPVNQLPDLSYYLDVEPEFWIVDYPWATIGFPYNLNEFSNPARDRYLGLLPDVVIKTKTNKFNIYPNPVKDQLTIACERPVNQALIQIFNINGRLILSDKINIEKNIQISVPDNIVPGVYSLVISSEKDYLATSIVIQ